MARWYRRVERTGDLLGPGTEGPQDQPDDRERHEEDPADEARRQPEVGERADHPDEPRDHRDDVARQHDLALAERDLELLQEELRFLRIQIADRPRELVLG